MLTGVIEVHDLDGTREVSIPDVPDPDRTISHEYFAVGSIPAVAPSFGVKTQAELLGRLNGTDVTGRILVPRRAAFCIGSGLREDTAEFGFARTGGLAGIFPLPALRPGKGHGYTGAVSLDIQNRNARSGYDG
jgi:hypothetical protein